MSSAAKPLSPAARLAIPLLVVLVASALVSGISGGLIRAGLVLAAFDGFQWVAPAVISHAALMIGGFLGTVISIERAVAVRLRFAFAAPVTAGLASLCILGGASLAGHVLLLVASLVFIVVNIIIVQRQQAAHTALLLLSAAAWAVGNVLALVDASDLSALPWWFGFLVLTIAAERLEMTRLMRRPRIVDLAFHACVALLVLGAALSIVSERWGGVLYGLALVLFAVWLLRYDIARRTVHTEGLSRFMAVCLLAGHTWLLVAGLAWGATALGWPLRDTALHAIGLGFVISMVMGHAPVILPAVARVRLLYGWPFYLPLAALHLTLVLRLAGGLVDHEWRALGAAGNAVAIAWFALTVIGSIFAARRQARRRPARA
ncbi:MAG: hypothetical protein ABS84_16490 [Rubrivivax sp. SCN 71-131]|jgi:hypothetical protein|nr:MAG: hypothetical protein ABS84_16490 [Rubrivivax sp. SCN 71-131]